MNLDCICPQSLYSTLHSHLPFQLQVLFFFNPLRQISAAHAHGYSWLHDHTVGHGQPANGQPPRKVTLHLIVVINRQCSSSTWSGASGSLTLPFWNLLSYIGCMQVTTVLVSSCITALSFPIAIFFSSNQFGSQN